MRLFFALWPPHATAAALHAWALEAQRETGGRVTRPDNIHLTLAFLGELSENRAQAAIAAARAARGAAHAMTLCETGYWRHNRIVWAGAREAPAQLASLAAGLGEALRDAGFALERRPFAAHVTLIRKARAARRLPALGTLDWPVAEFVLVASDLSREGSRYTVRERFPLSASA